MKHADQPLPPKLSNWCHSQYSICLLWKHFPIVPPWGKKLLNIRFEEDEITSSLFCDELQQELLPLGYTNPVSMYSSLFMTS